MGLGQHFARDADVVLRALDRGIISDEEARANLAECGLVAMNDESWQSFRAAWDEVRAAQAEAEAAMQYAPAAEYPPGSQTYQLPPRGGWPMTNETGGFPVG